MPRNDPLTALPNIGVKLASMLHDVGIQDLQGIKKAGAANLYKKLQAFSGKRLPVCYYLYSLEGAIRNTDWRDLSDGQKQKLCREAGLAVVPQRTGRTQAYG